MYSLDDDITYLLLTPRVVIASGWHTSSILFLSHRAGERHSWPQIFRNVSATTGVKVNSNLSEYFRSSGFLCAGISIPPVVFHPYIPEILKCPIFAISSTYTTKWVIIYLARSSFRFRHWTMIETRERNTLWASAASVLRKHWATFLSLVGVTGIGDLIREYFRTKVEDYAVSKLGWFGDLLVANPVTLTEIGIVLALVLLTVMVASESSKELPSAIYQDAHRPFMKPPTSKRWLASFISAMTIIIAVVCFGTYRHWVHTYRSLNAKATSSAQSPPPLPSAEMRPLQKSLDTKPTATQKKAISSAKHQADVNPPSSVVPSTSPQQTPVPQTQTFTEGDRERLSNLLYEFSKTLESMNQLASRANLQLGEIGNEIGSGSLVNDYESRIKTLNDISTEGTKIGRTFSIAREQGSWKYYSAQTSYVFGDNPDNQGPNAIINAASGLAGSLQRWSSIKDRDNRSALDLLRDPHNEATTFLRTFFDWRSGCERRLEQVRQSLK